MNHEALNDRSILKKVNICIYFKVIMHLKKSMAQSSPIVIDPYHTTNHQIY